MLRQGCLTLIVVLIALFSMVGCSGKPVTKEEFMAEQAKVAKMLHEFNTLASDPNLKNNLTQGWIDPNLVQEGKQLKKNIGIE